MQHLEIIKNRNFKSRGFGKPCDQVFVCLKATNEPTTKKIFKKDIKDQWGTYP